MLHDACESLAHCVSVRVVCAGTKRAATAISHWPPPSSAPFAAATTMWSDSRCSTLPRESNRCSRGYSHRRKRTRQQQRRTRLLQLRNRLERDSRTASRYNATRILKKLGDGRERQKWAAGSELRSPLRRTFRHASQNGEIGIGTLAAEFEPRALRFNLARRRWNAGCCSEVENSKSCS